MLSFLMTPALPLLRMLDPERAHAIAMRLLSLGLAPRAGAPDDPRLNVSVLGLQFSNPIGLAAGFDKNAEGGQALLHLGFGFVETGTVTPRPQPGNPRPRMFRLSEDRAVINRLGFNNKGLNVYRLNLAALSARRIPLGANVGINKDGAVPARDYPLLIEAVADLVDYAVINVSSPNTPGLRDLQAETQLRSILRAVAAVRHKPPVLVKVAPDLSQEGLATLVETCVDEGVSGLIVSNTTITRPASLRSSHAKEIGGLSGVPLRALSTSVLARAHRLARGRLVLIGVGGIFTGADVLEKIQAGASLVQLYTAFAYHGPALISRLKRELLQGLDASGFRTVAQAIGTRADELAGQG